MSEPAAPAPGLHRAEAESLLTGLFKLMDYPARLDFKDLADGALGVAVHFEGEVPGVQPGKRSYLVDCIQFLVNKAVNRPNVPRRWVNLAVDAFPEPRGQGQPPPPKAEAAPPPTAAPAPRDSGKQLPRVQAPPPKPPPPPAEPAAVTEDPTWTRLGKALAEKSTRLGRLYGVMSLSADNRARLQRAASGTPGLSVKVEGDGHWRRVVLTPATLAPVSKKHLMPDDDDEDEG